MTTPREILASGLRELGLDDSASGKLAELADLLGAWASRLNLTAHRSAEAIASRLILDAAALGCALPEAPAESIADLGSGAGFPGLPLAILWPTCSVTLVEARERRHHFQRAAIRALGLRNATALLGRAEELPPAPHAIVIAQAMARPDQALMWMRRWAGPKSWLVLPQSASPEPFDPPPGVFHVETRKYQVPAGGRERQIWTGRVHTRPV